MYFPNGRGHETKQFGLIAHTALCFPSKFIQISSMKWSRHGIIMTLVLCGNEQSKWKGIRRNLKPRDWQTEYINRIGNWNFMISLSQIAGDVTTNHYNSK